MWSSHAHRLPKESNASLVELCRRPLEADAVSHASSPRGSFVFLVLLAFVVIGRFGHGILFECDCPIGRTNVPTRHGVFVELSELLQSLVRDCQFFVQFRIVRLKGFVDPPFLSN